MTVTELAPAGVAVTLLLPLFPPEHAVTVIPADSSTISISSLRHCE
jgi:hypothetical protein